MNIMNIMNIDIKKILHIIKQINDNSFILENDIQILIEKCYKLNKKLNNTYFDNILYEIELNKYDEFYIFENVDKIRLLLNNL
jgi:hypothetical protein